LRISRGLTCMRNKTPISITATKLASVIDGLLVSIVGTRSQDLSLRDSGIFQIVCRSIGHLVRKLPANDVRTCRCKIFGGGTGPNCVSRLARPNGNTESRSLTSVAAPPELPIIQERATTRGGFRHAPRSRVGDGSSITALSRQQADRLSAFPRAQSGRCAS